MSNSKEIRWKQRFQNLENAFLLLQKATSKDELSELERGGLIQFFEMTLELSWKTLKDYLESQEYEVKTPRETIQIAFQNDIIDNGHVWIDALQKRNLMVHTYDESRALEAVNLIRTVYFQEIQKLVNNLKEKL